MRRRVRNDRSNKFIDGFLQTILNAGLFDANGALANEAWFQMFPRANVEKLVVPALNHYPILLDRDLVRFGGHIASLIKFENAWCLESEFDDVVHRCWNNYSDMLI
ncbi:hypothetical protein QL285_021341 [Trifolium repens]|jgi:hypothetical protein|nr:hypothetical protein QL285_021341 [Trifolium repens]